MISELRIHCNSFINYYLVGKYTFTILSFAEKLVVREKVFKENHKTKVLEYTIECGRQCFMRCNFLTIIIAILITLLTVQYWFLNIIICMKINDLLQKQLNLLSFCVDILMVIIQFIWIAEVVNWALNILPLFSYSISSFYYFLIIFF